MLPYWLLLAMFALGAVYFEGRPADRLPALPLILASTVAALMIGLRYKVGADWEPYRLIFQSMRYSSLGGAVIRSDPAYGLLNWVVKQLGWSLWVVNLVCGAIFMVGFHRFARRQSSPWIMMTIAVPYLIIVVGMGYNRQATALGFALLSFNAIQDRRFGLFLFHMLLASTFHRSALVLLPIVALSYSQNRLLSTLLGLVASVVGYVFILAPGVDTYINRYSGAEQGALESQGTFVRVLMNVVPAVLFFAFPSRFPVHGEYAKVWRNFAFLALASLAAFAYFGNNTAVDRLSIYLTPLQLFVLGNLPLVLRGREGSSRVALTLLLTYAVAVQLVWLVYASNAKSWLPYQLYPL